MALNIVAACELCADGGGRELRSSDRTMYACDACMPAHGIPRTLFADMGSGVTDTGLAWMRTLQGLRGCGLIYRVRIKRCTRVYFLHMAHDGCDRMSPYMDIKLRLRANGRTTLCLTGLPPLIRDGAYHVLRVCGVPLARAGLPAVRQFVTYPIDVLYGNGGQSVDRYRYIPSVGMSVVSVVNMKVVV